jgi:hypothetical protein
MLEEQKAKQQEQAALNHQKLLKYLPQQTAGQSLGMTESAKIAANNALVAQQGAAESEYNRGVAELNNYVREQEKAEQDGIYNEVMTTIDSGSWNTVDELKAYLWGEPTNGATGLVYSDKPNSLYSKLTPEQQAQVDQRLRMYENNPEQIAADNAYNNQKTLTVSAGKTTDVGGYLSNTKAGNNFTIGNYNVELGEAAAEGAVPADKVAKIADKVPFAYNGGIYIKINGTVYAVRGRGGNMSSDGYKNALDYLVNGTAASTSDTAGVSQTAPTSSSTTHWEKYYGNNKKHR